MFLILHVNCAMIETETKSEKETAPSPETVKVTSSPAISWTLMLSVALAVKALSLPFILSEYSPVSDAPVKTYSPAFSAVKA